MADQYITRAELDDSLTTLKMELLERIEKAETTLLNEFRKWAVPFGARTRVFETTSAALMERMTLPEKRMAQLEQAGQK